MPTTYSQLEESFRNSQRNLTDAREEIESLREALDAVYDTAIAHESGGKVISARAYKLVAKVYAKATTPNT